MVQSNKKKVLLGLSGGVDSAFAIKVLQDQGYEVHGIFMKNFSGIQDKLTGECNWVQDLAMARRVAAFREISLEVVDFEKEYRKYVIKPLFEDYKKGITPNPDIACNTIVKFPLLWKEVKKRGYDYLATGHYARIKKTSKGYELLRAKDETKDQSYFLYELSQEDLSHTLFPIGNYSKEEVRKQAKKYNFPNWNRSSTKGICFVGNIPLKIFLEQKLRTKKGKVLDEKGMVIGYHKGAHYYTLGERVRPTIGVEIEKGKSSQLRFFIVSKDRKKNTITVVPQGHPSLLSKEFMIKKMHWVQEEKKEIKANVRIRHLGALLPATLKKVKEGWLCTLSRPLLGIAPGQAAVFYQGPQVIGGGDVSS